MAWKMAEDAIDAIKTYLSANLAAKVTAVNAAINDSITLPAPAAFYVGQKSLSSVQNYPAFFLLATGADLLGWNNSYTDGEYEINIAFLVMNQDPEVIQRMLYRYTRALWECLVDAHFASPGLSGFKILGEPRVNYSDTFASSSDFLAEGSMTLKARKQETR